PRMQDELPVYRHAADLAAWGRELLRRVGESDVAAYRYYVADRYLFAVQWGPRVVVVGRKDGEHLLWEGEPGAALAAYRSGARTPLAEFGCEDPITGERARLAPRVARLLERRTDVAGARYLYAWEVCALFDMEMSWSIAWLDGAYVLRRWYRDDSRERETSSSALELMDRLESWLLD
ncbi:hypothetical protein ACH0AH_14525, partial [Microbacterium paludicola]|uniref:hypothetical protein n=1 Tax=Microbacterium paludicola TaxID=300019 RepID=UPI00387A532F